MMRTIMKSMRLMICIILLVVEYAQKTTALKCQLVAMISDGNQDEREVKCQIGDRLLSIDNHLDEFDDFLNGPHAENPNFDFDFSEATIANHTFHIPFNSTMFYDSVKSDNGSHRSGRRLGGKDPRGDQRVLVLYVEDGVGNTPSYVADGVAGSVEDNVFGTYSDPVYVGERVSLEITLYITCSCCCVCSRSWFTYSIILSH